MIHLSTSTGKTVCGMLICKAGISCSAPGLVTCPECRRVMDNRKRYEKVVKDYPEGSVAESYAVREKK